MVTLKESVEHLKRDNSELKLRLTLWERKNKINIEDAAGWRNMDDIINQAGVGSPTPTRERSVGRNPQEEDLGQLKHQAPKGKEEKIGGRTKKTVVYEENNNMDLDEETVEEWEPAGRNTIKENKGSKTG